MDLLVYFNRFGYVFLPQGSQLEGEYQPLMGQLCESLGWEPLFKFGLHPPNSPAVLIHWRVLLILLGFLSPLQRVEFAGLFGDKFSTEGRIAPPLPVMLSGETQQNRPSVAKSCTVVRPTGAQDLSVSAAASVPVRLRLGGRLPPQAMVVEQREGTGLLPPPQGAFDSHFHLDRLSASWRGANRLTTSDAVVSAPRLPKSKTQIPVMGGVEVYSLTKFGSMKVYLEYIYILHRVYFLKNMYISCICISYS